MKKIFKQAALLLMAFIGVLLVASPTARADYENAGTVYFHYAVGSGTWTYNQTMQKEGNSKYYFTVKNLNNATVHFGFSKGQASGGDNDKWNSVFKAGKNVYTCGDNDKGETTPSQNQQMYLYDNCDHNNVLSGLNGDVTFYLDLSRNDYGVFTYGAEDSKKIPTTLWVNISVDGGNWNSYQLTNNNGTFTFNSKDKNITIGNGKNLLYRFGVTSDDATGWNSSDTQWSPAGGDESDQTLSTGETNWASNQGSKCWKAVADKEGYFTFTGSYNDWNHLTFSVTFDGKETPAVWSYSVNNGNKTTFTTSTGGITVNQNDVVYLWKDNTKMATTTSGNQSVSGHIDATDLKASDYGFKAASNGTMTLTLSDNNTKVAVDFTATGVPVVGDKVLYLAYDNGHTNENNYKWVFANYNTTDGKTFTYDIEVYEQQPVYYRFMTDQDLLKEWNNRNANLYAPIGNANENYKTNQQTLAQNNVEGGKGCGCFWERPDAHGTYHVTATLNDNGTISFSIVFQPDQVVDVSTLYYTKDNGAKTMVTTKAVIPGQYTQWSVNVKGGVVRFYVGDTMYGVSSNGNYVLNKDYVKFMDLSTGNEAFQINDNQEYQFLIRQWDAKAYPAMAGKFYVACRRIKDANFPEYSFTPTTYPTQELGNITISLSNAKAGSAFCAGVEFDEESGEMKSSNGAEGFTTTYHWVKYEHPFWGFETAAQMATNAVDDKGNPVSVGSALYQSDSYLTEDDPRVKAHFNELQLELMRQGKRSHSIDKFEEANFACRNLNADKNGVYYRVYVTSETQHGATEVAPSAAPAFRAPVSTGMTSQYKSRVAYSAPLPGSTGDFVVSGVEDVRFDAAADAEAEYYTISGVRVYGDPEPGVYICRQGNKVTKVIIR